VVTVPPPVALGSRSKARPGEASRHWQATPRHEAAMQAQADHDTRGTTAHGQGLSRNTVPVATGSHLVLYDSKACCLGTSLDEAQKAGLQPTRLAGWVHSDTKKTPTAQQRQRRAACMMPPACGAVGPRPRLCACAHPPPADTAVDHPRHHRCCCCRCCHVTCLLPSRLVHPPTGSRHAPPHHRPSISPACCADAWARRAAQTCRRCRLPASAPE
jgi:hypothetical protein